MFGYDIYMIFVVNMMFWMVLVYVYFVYVLIGVVGSICVKNFDVFIVNFVLINVVCGNGFW